MFLACDTRDISREIKDEHFLFCIAAKTFPITSGTIFFYQNVALIESFIKYVNNAENGILDFSQGLVAQV